MPADDEVPSDSVEYACHNASKTIDQQLEKIYKEDQKAVKMVRVNLLVVGIVTSGLSFVAQTGEINIGSFVNAHTTIGVGSLLISTVLGGMAYTTSSFELGIGADAIEDALAMEDKDFFQELADDYSEWIGKNNTVHKKNSSAIEYTIITAIVGIVFLLIGVVIGVAGIKGDPISYLVLLGELVLTVIVYLLINSSDTLLALLISDGA
jgi:hypothetical protein